MLPFLFKHFHKYHIVGISQLILERRRKMILFVNGKELEAEDNISVMELLNSLEINSDIVVVEIDLEIISKDKYLSTKLFTNSKVEIIRFVGGG